MTFPTFARLSPAVVALCLATGCPSDGGHDHGANIPCAEDTRDEAYEPGMEKTTDAGLMTVVLDEADPGPIDIGSNNWTVSVADAASGDPALGCTITAVPWMTDHGHGSNEPVGTEDGDGVYTVTDIQVTMAGLWDTELQLNCPGIGEDTVHFVFCIDG